MQKKMRRAIIVIMGLVCDSAVAENLTVLAKSVRGNGVIWLASGKCKVPADTGQSAAFVMKDGGNYGCWRLDGNTINLTWYGFSSGLRKITDEKVQTDQLKNFVAVEGAKWPPAISSVNQEKTHSAVSRDRLVKGWGDDPGWQWTDKEIRKYDSAWRTLNLASPVDCTPMSLDDVRSFERAFVGHVVHIWENGLPTVFMVRDGVRITFMPIDTTSCRIKAERAARF
jgi:hypothetical protein